MTGKSKPELGIYLVDEPKASRDSVTADLILSGGIIATAAFESPWPLAQGGYYDVEKSTREGDAAYLQVVGLGKGESLKALPPKWFGEKLFSVDGRYGAYGAPTDIKVKASGTEGEPVFDVSFTALTPGGSEVPRRGIVRAIQAPGSPDVLLLTCTTTPTRWKKEGADAVSRSAVGTFRVVATRPTDLKPEPQADYRYGKTSGPSTMSSRNDGF
uniref:Uncharacterized protein n=1 Tax=Haptolina ericina TaxID=156174 RepID=A0A7S3BS30_9EUKA